MSEKDDAIQHTMELTNFKPRQILDGPKSLWDLAQALITGELKAPPHQRSTDAWNLQKQSAWFDRCRMAAFGEAPDPLGTACIYALTSEGENQEYLNEGLQRISAAAKAIQFPEMFGSPASVVKAVLKGTMIYVQNRRYESHKDASRDFELVNNGTLLRPAERHKHILVYADNWDIVWKTQVDMWGQAVNLALASYSKTLDQRGKTLDRNRAILQLFSVAHIGRPTSYGTGPELERVVEQCFVKSNPDVVLGHIKTMRNFSAVIERAWRSVKSDHAELMQDALARWCIGVMFLHHDKVRPLDWERFLKELFQKTKGSAQFVYEEKTRTRTIGLTTRLEAFNRICRYLGFDFDTAQKRSRSTGLLKHGFQAHHSLPFADHGDGPTEPLPALLNAAKNART